MLRLIDGFDSPDLSNWFSTADLRMSSGRVAGQCMEMRSNGTGLFFSMSMLGLASQGTFGFAAHLGSASNTLAVVFYYGSEERYRVTFAGNGSIQTTTLGRSVGATGVGSFPYLNWNCFEVLLQDGHGVVAANGRKLITIPHLVCSFDRVAFVIGDNQVTAVRIDDVYFDDNPAIRGDTIVLSGAFPFIPTAIYGIKQGSVIQTSNPATGAPWTYRDVLTLTGVSVLASRTSTVASSHSFIAQ